MTAKEGWYEDPAGRHEFRWFSQGAPTDLVKDGQLTAHDAISLKDPQLYEQMDLAEPPDTAPLLHVPDDRPPHFEILNLGAGPVLTINTNARPADDTEYPGRPAGIIEILVVMLPLFVGFVVCAAIKAPGIAYVAIVAFSLCAAIIGRLRRQRETNRIRRQARTPPPR